MAGSIMAVNTRDWRIARVAVRPVPWLCGDLDEAAMRGFDVLRSRHLVQ